ncbi:MAG TPA: DNA recombination/repair protein RecA, partial [Prochlorococcus sp.]|nr:DNA recombination/repair protein RecA [Prochlorococcus sp.]
MSVDVKSAQSSKSDSLQAEPRPGERDKALNLVLGQIERNFGKGSIMRLGDASRMRVETFPTGALT